MRPEEEHHELALVRSADHKTDAQQVSFTVASLADLKAFHAQIKARGYTIDRVVNHGIAFGCIWTALALYVASMVRDLRAKARRECPELAEG